MKKQTIILILVILFALICGVLNAQSNFRLNKTDSFNFGIVVDPCASIKEKGLNIGAEIEYVGTVYTRASVTYFGVLNGSYLDLIGAIGINFTSGYFEQFRYYAGGRLGVIRRSNNTYPTAGIEAGIDYKITDGISIGLRTTYDNRTDFEFYGEPSSMRQSGFIKLGFSL
jgi:hypothetical protein